MRSLRYAIVLLLCIVAGFAQADFPVSGTGGTGSVTSALITDGTIVAGDIADNTITSAKLLDNTIANGKLLDNTIAGGKLASDIAITTSGAIATTGNLSGKVMILDNVAAPTAAQSYGSVNLVNDNITVLLPTAVAGMSTCIIDSGTAHDIIVDVQATDNMVLVGSVGAGGLGITNAAGTSTGDFVCLVAAQANKWYVTTKQGTWASQ